MEERPEGGQPDQDAPRVQVKLRCDLLAEHRGEALDDGDLDRHVRPATAPAVRVFEVPDGGGNRAGEVGHERAAYLRCRAA